mmetsp:Transcript_55691/g.121275  ORF Transcript_55691/g.121275 Transcript_55691/m.121275 type:complete len:99 (+) Transcript_55691:363-659(+)
MRAILRVAVNNVVASSPVLHTRSMPDRGPCILAHRKGKGAPDRLLNGWVKGTEVVENLTRSVLQLFCGVWSVTESRKLRLAQKYFAEADAQQAVKAEQ